VNNANLPAWCQNVINESSGYYPVFNRPYVNVTNSPNYPLLAIAFNSDQVARCFEDRSYVLQFASYPGRNGATIWNLNNRGRRGNIVQCYPAVENSFYPVILNMDANDLLHVQFCGSDFNPANNPNDGEGWQYSTRYNLVPQFWGDRRKNFPNLVADSTGYMFDATTSVKLAVGNQTQVMTFPNNNTQFTCVNYQGDNSDAAQNSIYNCAKMNPAQAHVDYGVHSMAQGTYHYVATRNNNFSNRHNKGILNVFGDSFQYSAAAAAGIAVGTLVGCGAVGAAAVVFYAKKRPNSRIARMLSGNKAAATTGYLKPATRERGPSMTASQ